MRGNETLYPATGVLAGLKVVDLSRVLAGPLCTQMLSDHGADVIKIESPTGDETRTLGPPFDAAGNAAYYRGLNRGKRALSLDLARAEGRAVLERLLDGADVLVENFLPGTMERWGLGYEQALEARYPRLIYCSISGFGRDGPLGGLPGYDAVVQAMSGVMSVNGTPETGALRVGMPLIDILTGHNALIGILLVLQARAQSGRGQRVEVTLCDTALSLLLPHAPNWFASGREPTLTGNAHPNVAPYEKFQAGEGELFLGIVNDRQFKRLCELLGRAELADDARFKSNRDRVAHRAALRAELAPALATQEAGELCARLMRHGIPAGAVLNVPQTLEHPHTHHREMVVERKGYRGIGLPVKLSHTPGAPQGTPPRLGEHSASILKQAGYSAGEIEALVSARVVVQAAETGEPQ